MASGAFSALFMLVTVLLLLSITPGGTLKMVAAQDGAGEKSWCVARPSTADPDLIKIIDYACSQAGVDCNVINQGGPCSLPDTNLNKASVAMNMYYQANGRQTHTCFFDGAGLIVYNDPSYGSCKF